MGRVVVAVFESAYVAKKAFADLLDVGYTSDKIQLRVEQRVQSSLDKNARNFLKAEGVRSEAVLTELQAGIEVGAGVGASLGIVGSLFVRFGELHLPLMALIPYGNGSVFLEMAALAGICLAAGGILGSLLSGLIGLGVPENEVEQYAKTARRSNITLLVMANWDSVDETIAALEKYNPLEIQQRAVEGKKTGEKEKKPAEQGRNANVEEQDRSR